MMVTEGGAKAVPVPLVQSCSRYSERSFELGCLDVDPGPLICRLCHVVEEVEDESTRMLFVSTVSTGQNLADG